MNPLLHKELMKPENHIRILLIGLVLSLGLAVSPAKAAPDLESARAVVQKITDTGISDVVSADIAHDEKIMRFRNLFNTWFDMPSIARFVLGRFWRAGSEAEQQEFVEMFRELNIYTWARRFNEYNGQKIVVTTATADGDAGAFVESLIQKQDGTKPMTVLWRLRSREEGWKVVDISVEGVSMAITFRSEYTAKLSEPGVGLSSLNTLVASQINHLANEKRP